jgi:hypothetical protein
MKGVYNAGLVTIRNMSGSPQYLHGLFIFVSLLQVARGSVAPPGCPSFPDDEFIAYSVNNIGYPYSDYTTDHKCVWGCGSSYTGRGCGEQCDTTLDCGLGERLISCSPPRNSECVTCRQNNDEAVNGGYSFDVYNPNNQQYELLYGRGSFESAKLYPSTGTGSSVMLVRDAVRDAHERKRWNDIMFTGNTVYSWYGRGTIELQYSTSLWERGASRSDVFMRLMPLYTEFMICDIHNPDNDPNNDPGYTPPRRTRGILYEFRYRQLVAYEEYIEVNVALTNSLGDQLVVGEKSYKLPPTSVWTDDRRLFDDLAPTDVHDTVCINFGFTLRKSRELLIDDVRVFSNLFWNGRFTHADFNNNDADSVPSWERPSQTGYTNTATLEAGGIPNSEYVVLPQSALIKQTVVLQDNNGAPGVLAAMFSMDVRGVGLLDVTYASRSNTGDVDTTTIVSKHMTQDDVDDIDANIWRTLTIPVNMDESHVDHVFTIKNSGYVEDLRILYVDNVILYIDNERCPVKACDDPHGHVFVNGNCEPCGATTPLDAFTTGQRIIGCKVSFATQRDYIYADCPLVFYAGEEVSRTENRYIAGDTECSYDCSEGFWYSRNGSMHNGPTCEICTDASSLNCNVGWHLSDCAGESDRGCVPCNTLSAHESAMVYSIDATKDCPHVCTPTRFSYEDSTCLACTESICGDEQNGFTSLRVLDGLQYTSECTDTRDSQCKSCNSVDEHLHFTKNGAEIGHWCEYECKAGHMRCPVCEWDANKAVAIVNIPLHTYSTATNSVRLAGEIPFNAELSVRFTGSVRISTAEYGTVVELEIRIVPVVPGVDYTSGVVLTLTPLVPPSALALMQVTGDNAFISNAPEQLFDVTVDMRSFVDAYVNEAPDIRNIPDAEHVVVYELRLSQTTDIISTVSDFVVEVMNVSTTGCCAWDVDVSKAIRCQSCKDGINMDLPLNARWDEPDDCTWVCNTDYEMLHDGSGCEYCPELLCNSGFYWAACGVCSECNTPETNMGFTGPGTIQFDSASCPTSCVDGFYYNQDSRLCVQCTSPTTLNCSTNTGDPYFELGCSEFEDTKCVNCLICPIGLNASTPCTSSEDTVCTGCNTTLSNPPALAEWVLGETSADYCVWECPTGTQVNLLKNTCFKCNNNECTVGQYPTECTIYNNYDGCQPCRVPPNATAMSVGSAISETSCRWQCVSDHHYNVTTNTCDEDIIVVPNRINTFVDTPLCSASICGWGSFLAPEFAQLPLSDDPPCADRCKECPILPVIVIDDKTTTSAVYTRKGSCAWVCMTPFMQDADKCVSVY